MNSMKTKLKCKITPGMFDNEVIIKSKDIDNNDFSIFVDKMLVDEEESSLEVMVLKEYDNYSIIRLPNESSNLGSVIRISNDYLQKRII